LERAILIADRPPLRGSPLGSPEPLVAKLTARRQRPLRPLHPLTRLSDMALLPPERCKGLRLSGGQHRGEPARYPTGKTHPSLASR